MLRNLTLALFGTATLVHAGESDIVRVGLGASAVSRYTGSDEVAVVPAAQVVLQHGPWRLDTITYRKPFAGAALEAAGGDVEILVGAAFPGPDSDAGAGLRSTHLILEGLVPLTRGWEGVFQLEFAWLQADAADSPLTANRQQLDATRGLAYRF